MERALEPRADLHEVLGGLGHGARLVGHPDGIADQHRVHGLGDGGHLPPGLVEQGVVHRFHFAAVGDVAVHLPKLTQAGAGLAPAHPHEEVGGHLRHELARGAGPDDRPLAGQPTEGGRRERRRAREDGGPVHQPLEREHEGGPGRRPDALRLAQRGDALAEVGVVGGHHPADAGRERLVPLEGPVRCQAERAAPPPLVRGAEGEAAVLDHGQAVPVGDGQDGVHLARVAVGVLGDDDLRARGDGLLQKAYVHVVGDRLDVHEDAGRPQVRDRVDVHDAGVAGQDDLVALADAEGLEDGVHGHAALPEGEGARGAEPVGEGGFEVRRGIRHDGVLPVLQPQ